MDNSLCLTKETPDSSDDSVVVVSERCGLVADIYQNNMFGNGYWTQLQKTHSFKVDVSDKPVDEQSIAFDHNDYPYLKLALLDTYLDELLEK
jgi:hypothetical protein